MENKLKIGKEDVLFYLDMINSRYGPSYKPKFGKLKGYFKLIKNQDSKEYKTFVGVYKYFRETINEREKTILDLQYGLDGNALTMIQIGEQLGICDSRVGQLRNKAEYRIADEIKRYLDYRKG